MSKPNTNKTYRALFLLLSCLLIFTALYGCGSGANGDGGLGSAAVTVTATPESVAAGSLSVIVAQVKKADGTASANQTVNFGWVTNNSGATLSIVNDKTDANGTAIATYTAGSLNPSSSIQDAVSASVTGSAGTVIITRQPPSTGRLIALTLTPSTLLSTTGTCDVQAMVLEADGSTIVVGEIVTFSIVTGEGSILPLTDTTDALGIANTTFTGPGGVLTGNAVVRAQIVGGDAVGIIYW